MFKRIRSQRKQSFHLRRYVHPGPHFGAPTAAPGFGGESHLEGVQKWQVGKVRQQTVPRINPVNDTRQFSNILRCWFRMLLERRAELLQLRRRERLFFQQFENVREKEEAFRVGSNSAEHGFGSFSHPLTKQRFERQNEE